MINWLKELFHIHKYKILVQHDLLCENNKKYGKLYVLQCIHCGKLNKYKVADE